MYDHYPFFKVTCIVCEQAFSVILYLIVFFELIDFLARMGVWVLDGVVWHKELLPFVLNKNNIDNTLVMIVVDLTQPWAVLDSLERWSEVIYRHVMSLKIPDKQRSAMEEKSKYKPLSFCLCCF